VSCGECERLRDLQDSSHRSYLERVGNVVGEGQTTKIPNGPELELKDVYDAAAAEYKDHVATAHSLPPPL
jgi:hypothetical protein